MHNSEIALHAPRAHMHRPHHATTDYGAHQHLGLQTFDVLQDLIVIHNDRIIHTATVSLPAGR